MDKPKIGELREGYIARWKDYPTDEIKIRVARPSVLAPSQKLLHEFMMKKKEWIKCGLTEIEARRRTWGFMGYRRRFLQEVLKYGNTLAEEMIERIVNTLLSGENVRLICFEREPPCHRFILKEIIEKRVFREIAERS